MLKKYPYILYTFILISLSLLVCKFTSYADETYYNNNTLFTAKIIDHSDILSINQEAHLGWNLQDLTEYCNVAILTTYTTIDDTNIYAESYCEGLFDEEDALLVMVNTYSHSIVIYTNGTISNKITETDCQLILAAVTEYRNNDIDYASCIDYILSTAFTILEETENMNYARYTNPITGYEAVIEDIAILLSAAELESLMEHVQPITEYGNVAFVTVKQTHYSSEETARNYYYDFFGTESGTLFLIDMDNRYIWIHSDGDVYKTINTNYANTITDNAYQLATDQKYYECAIKVYGEILTLLAGGKIAQPMKYICNVFLGFMIALLINFCWMTCHAYLKRPRQKELLAGISHHFDYEIIRFKYSHNKRERKSSSSSGHGGGGFRGGGGGFRSGGGGGHRF